MSKKLNNSQKEHPHTNFFDYNKNKPINEKWCKVRTFKCPKKIKRPDIKLDVNTLNEYNYMANIYKNLYHIDAKFNISKTIDFLDKNEK